MGTVKEAAIKFLVDNSNIAAAISHKCDDLDQRSLKSMNKTSTPTTDEAAELRKRVMELEAKLKDKQPEEEVKFNDQFADMEDIEFNELKAKGKEYKISGYNLPTMTKEKLKAKVEEYEAKLESKK
jgi:hypothetical protein